ncbi:MAG: hypothetical protein ACOC4R_00445 [Bacteroidota bacterium]
MNTTFTLEEISHFSDAEIDRFIDEFLINGNHQQQPGSSVINNILNFSRVYAHPLAPKNYPGIIHN